MIRIIYTSIIAASLLSINAYSIEISNRLNLTAGIPEFIDIKYGVNISKTTIFIRPGIGWFFAYKLANQEGWEISPELSVLYNLLNHDNIAIGPEVGISYVYHNGYFNTLGSSNYWEESKFEILFGNIRAKVLWKLSRQKYNLFGTIGCSIAKEIYTRHIIVNNKSIFRNEFGRTGCFPLISIGIENQL